MSQKDSDALIISRCASQGGGCLGRAVHAQKPCFGCLQSCINPMSHPSQVIVRLIVAKAPRLVCVVPDLESVQKCRGVAVKVCCSHGSPVPQLVRRPLQEHLSWRACCAVHTVRDARKRGAQGMFCKGGDREAWTGTALTGYPAARPRYASPTPPRASPDTCLEGRRVLPGPPG